MSGWGPVNDSDVPRNRTGLQLVTLDQWQSRSILKANLGVSPGRYYTTDEAYALDDTARGEYFAIWAYFCYVAVRVRRPARGITDRNLRPGAPAPNQQALEEDIARYRGRLGNNQANHHDQVRAAGWSPDNQMTVAVGEPKPTYCNAGKQPDRILQYGPDAPTPYAANWPGASGGAFITPPKGNKAIPIRKPPQAAPSRDLTVSAEPVSGAKSPVSVSSYRSEPVPDRSKSWYPPDLLDAIMGRGKYYREEKVPIRPMDDKLKSSVTLGKRREVIAPNERSDSQCEECGELALGTSETASVTTGTDKACDHSRFHDLLPIRPWITDGPLELCPEHDCEYGFHPKSIFDRLLFGPSLPPLSQLHQLSWEEIRTPECPKAIKEAAKCDDLSWWATPWVKDVLLKE